jgi:hypothetical protein
LSMSHDNFDIGHWSPEITDSMELVCLIPLPPTPKALRTDVLLTRTDGR